MKPNMKMHDSALWLRTNYGHIWHNDDLSTSEKAGLLAASCSSQRCYLMTLSLRERLDVIEYFLRPGELKWDVSRY